MSTLLVFIISTFLVCQLSTSFFSFCFEVATSDGIVTDVELVRRLCAAGCH